MGFLKCAIYIIIIDTVMFFLGRLIPKKWIKENRFPFRSYAFEKEGKFYEKLKIKKWKMKLPDMSRIFHKMMPVKKLGNNYKDKLPILIKETCIAEIVHFLLCLLGLQCISLWRGVGGVIIGLIHLVFNVPFILIQRYNRPRLVRAMKANLTAEEETEEENSTIETETVKPA